MEEDDGQEWTFTLYGFDNSGKATREVTRCVLRPTVPGRALAADRQRCLGPHDGDRLSPLQGGGRGWHPS